MWDSNPRNHLWFGGLVNRCLQPLGQSSNIFTSFKLSAFGKIDLVSATEHLFRRKVKQFTFLPLGQSSNILILESIGIIPEIIAKTNVLSIDSRQCTALPKNRCCLVRILPSVPMVFQLVLVQPQRPQQQLDHMPL